LSVGLIERLDLEFGESVDLDNVLGALYARALITALLVVTANCHDGATWSRCVDSSEPSSNGPCNCTLEDHVRLAMRRTEF